jgi:hypothetical protein
MAKTRCELSKGNPWFHCIVRFTLGLHALGGSPEAKHDVRQIAATHFAQLLTLSFVLCGSFSIMPSHHHSVLRSNPAAQEAATDDLVIRMMAQRRPHAKGVAPARKGLANTHRCKASDVPLDELVEAIKASQPLATLLPKWRASLGSISELMKDFDQWLTNLIRQRVTAGELILPKGAKDIGHWIAKRFASHPIDPADTELLVFTMAYVDANPFAAGLCQVPEEAIGTSIHARLLAGTATPAELASFCQIAPSLNLTKYRVALEGLCCVPRHGKRQHLKTAPLLAALSAHPDAQTPGSEPFEALKLRARIAHLAQQHNLLDEKQRQRAMAKTYRLSHQALLRRQAAAANTPSTA